MDKIRMDREIVILSGRIRNFRLESFMRAVR